MSTPQSETDIAWSTDNLADPHKVADKAARVERMFAAIAPSYDLNNRVHSLWRDQAWRRRTVKLAGVDANCVVVDVACGTGDQALAFADAAAQRVIGIDFTQPMLDIAEVKRQRAAAAYDNVSFQWGDAMRLDNVPDSSADIVSITFGIRNVAKPQAAIDEFARILKPGGRLVILEFSLPRNVILRGLYNFYFKQILPRSASLIARDRSGAYRYLPQSVNTFIGREELIAMMRSAGFIDVKPHALTFGVAVCYRGIKP